MLPDRNESCSNLRRAKKQIPEWVSAFLVMSEHFGERLNAKYEQIDARIK